MRNDRTVLVVVAAVVERDGRFLVTRRLEGTHLAGSWEFPGGKCDAGESHEGCLRREMREELAVDVSMGPLELAVTHDYHDRTVELHFYRCWLEGEPAPQIGQEMRWAPRDELKTLEFPPADAELIDLLARSDEHRHEVRNGHDHEGT
jgi:8-oxo-dGTP diphosphatase